MHCMFTDETAWLEFKGCAWISQILSFYMGPFTELVQSQSWKRLEKKNVQKMLCKLYNIQGTPFLLIVQLIVILYF